MLVVDQQYSDEPFTAAEFSLSFLQLRVLKPVTYSVVNNNNTTLDQIASSTWQRFVLC